MDQPDWEECIFCKRKWESFSIELELCPHCLNELRLNPYEYDAVKVEQRLKYGDFKDTNLAECVLLLMAELKKMKELL